MIKLIASDLDGTIIDTSNNICKDNISAIEKINNKNIPFVVCTGKTYSIYKDICSSFDASYGIFGNGTSIVDLKNGKTIYQNLLDTNDVIKSIEIAKRNNLHVHIYTEDYIITEKLLYLDLKNYKLQENNTSKSNLQFKIVSNLLDYVKTNILSVSKVIISGTSSLENIKTEIEKSLNVDIYCIKKYGKYKDEIINKEYEYLDIIPKNTSKNTALNFLSSYLNIPKNDILAVGDNLNDLSLIENAGIGVAVENAYPELKQVAKFTTKAPVEKGAFAEAVYKFVEF